MDPFNIIIKDKGRHIDLNIHPQKPWCYKVIYQGVLVGEIFITGEGKWEAISAYDLDSSNYSINSHGEPSIHADLLMDYQVVQLVGAEISISNNL